MTMIWPIRAGVLSGLLTLLFADSTVVAKRDRAQWSPQLQQSPRYVHVTPSDVPALVQRVDFVLDQAAQAEADAKKKRKAEQRHAVAPATKPNAKAASVPAASVERATGNRPPSTASSAGASTTARGAQSSASEPKPSGADTSTASAVPLAPVSSAVGAAPAPAGQQQVKPGESVNASAVAMANPIAQGNPPHSASGRPLPLTRDQLIALMPGATILRTNTAGALREWVNVPNGTLTVYWAGGGFVQSHSASGKWSVTDDGRFCLQIDWENKPENWCRFLEPTPKKGTYQPVPDVVDEKWTPPTDQTDWRPLTIRH
ncbi:DUF995 domain-containing protein [Burkholderia sp. Ac-20365]|uniref:DUF995 domain-containing protein n=1 Tax=Burkholderia sp. Ac-20365 TaxID=2703897 RepID=UPI00197B1ECA|nr:DUF995 domain-containing protein [Burkholderia sp. Ac-20365]MBN3760649.1 DUF995 domain-containing protein [Burkholderia sp. Ac-20365]